MMKIKRDEEKLVAISSKEGIALPYKALAVFLVMFVGASAFVAIKTYEGGYEDSIDTIESLKHNNNVLADSVAVLRAKMTSMQHRINIMVDEIDDCNATIERIKIVIATHESN